MVVAMMRCMRVRKGYNVYVAAAICVSIQSIGGLLQAMVTNNPYNNSPIYNPFCSDQFYPGNRCGQLRLFLSPFYQQTRTARTFCGKKVKAGDRLGHWNMLATLLPSTLPASPGIDLATIQSIAASVRTDVPAYTPGSGSFTSSTYAFPSGADLLNKPIDQGTISSDQRPEYGLLKRLPVIYERIGIRGQARIDFTCGLGVSVKFGVLDYRNKPIFEDSLGTRMLQLLDVAPLTTIVNGSSTTASYDPLEKQRAEKLYELLLSEKARNKIARAYGLDLATDTGISAEDVHVQFFWHMPYECCDDACEVVMRFASYLAIGGWIPAAREEKVNTVFSQAVGNNGYYGLTLDGAANFVFPTPGTNQNIQAGFGAGLTFFPGSKTVTRRVPFHRCQSGIYPSKTTLSYRPGLSWYMRGSLLCENFIQGLSFVFDYIYTAHLTDSISLREPNPTRAKLINDADGIKHIRDDSSWRSQQVNFGMHYQASPCVGFGGAVQGHISGTRVYRPTTLLGTMTFTF